MADISAEQHRINRINELLDRLDKIPSELDAIHEKLYAGNMDRNTFAKLVDQRSSLFTSSLKFPSTTEKVAVSSP